MVTHDDISYKHFVIVLITCPGPETFQKFNSLFIVIIIYYIIFSQCQENMQSKFYLLVVVSKVVNITVML